MAKNDLGIKGTAIKKSAALGPTVAVLAMVHGNEPVRLACYKLLNQIKLKRGQVYFLLGNIYTAKKYFLSPAAEAQRYRFLRLNLNRIPATFKKLKSKEANRLQQLLKILRNVDYVLDFHSTSLKSQPMLIPNKPGLTKTFFP